jgi:4-hydroxy-tetrahydrodipicolinate reductase
LIRVIINGCNGKMGKEIIAGLTDNDEIQLVGTTGRNDNLEQEIKIKKSQVVVDFTHPSTVYNNIKVILKNKSYAVVGTTGLTDDQKDDIDKMAKLNGVGILIAPNFSIAAILMMKFAVEAAKYMPHVEIVEYHHDQKADTPSGTAIKTAENINIIAGKIQKSAVASKELSELKSLGTKIGNIRIHSVRLPGFIASQEVIFGENGQSLKIRHDTINRSSFIPGIILGIKEISKYTGLIYGLENLLWPVPAEGVHTSI